MKFNHSKTAATKPQPVKTSTKPQPVKTSTKKPEIVELSIDDDDDENASASGGLNLSTKKGNVPEPPVTISKKKRRPLVEKNDAVNSDNNKVEE